MGNRTRYLFGIVALAGLSLLMAALIVVGEMRNNYTLGGSGLGVILLAYGLIQLCLRRLGFIGPRNAEGK